MPQIDFETKTLNPFKNGLGSITLDKNTLLQTAEQTDTCGRRSAITYAAGTPDQQSGHDQRVTKLFHCLLNYIDTRSGLYIFLMEHVQPDGVVAWSHIISFGRCPIPLPITFAGNDAWQMLTMDSMRIDYTIDALFKWAEIVEYYGKVINKSAEDMKSRFIDGIPSFFDPQKAQMVVNTSAVYPGTYGGIAGMTLSTKAATAHPMAGEPWVMRLARLYHEPWCKAIKKIHTKAPFGMLRCAEAFNIPEAVIHLLSTKDVSDNTKCYYCDGKGHAARQLHPNGVDVIVCAKKAIDDLNRTGQSTANLADIDDATASEFSLPPGMSDKIEDVFASALNKAFTRKFRKSPTTRSVQSSVTGDDSDDMGDCETADEDDDDASASSAVEASEFAQAIGQRGRTPPRRNLKPSGKKRN